MKKTHTLIKGTLLLTITGLVSRMIGFYYRIFLSRTIGAEGVGIYQLIFPLYALCIALTASGIQTAISRLVAANAAKGDYRSSNRTLQVGLFLSLTLSLLAGLFIYYNSTWLAVNILMEERCAPLLNILAFSFPPCCIHSCINGYYYGLKKSGIPALTQLTEQLVRVLSVYVIYTICKANHIAASVEIAVIGLVFGECSSMLLSVTAFNVTTSRQKNSFQKAVSNLRILKPIISQSFPLTLNHVLLHILQSIEAILIPSRLRLFGLNQQDSLSIYGVLTGMALPLILFPSALTNSVSVMLLPAVAEAQAENNTAKINIAVYKSIQYCLVLGIFCTGTFLTFGRGIGSILFSTSAAGSFIITLAWICPFLYLSTTLGSIAHGLGKTTSSFFFHVFCMLIRIGFILFCIPIFGINGYLWGLLLSQLTLTVLFIVLLNRMIHIHFCAADWILKPILSILLAMFLINQFSDLFMVLPFNNLIKLMLEASIFTISYGCCLYLLCPNTYCFTRKKIKGENTDI